MFVHTTGWILLYKKGISEGGHGVASEIYLFGFKCSSKEEWSKNCMKERMGKLYDVKKIHDTMYLIKTTEDIGEVFNGVF